MHHDDAYTGVEYELPEEDDLSGLVRAVNIGDTVAIGPDIRLKVLKIDGKRVTWIIDAPRDMAISCTPTP